MRATRQLFFRALVLLTLYFLFHRREGESGSWNRSVETHSNSTSQYIDGLNPYTVYLFRVAAENALGYSKPGKESYPTLTHRERESYFLLLYCRRKIRSGCIYLTFGSFLYLCIQETMQAEFRQSKNVGSTPIIFFATKLAYKTQTVGLPLCYFYGNKKVWTFNQQMGAAANSRAAFY